ncbi:trifunctional serine/threonine-protein kinase/ATP-binding protein/sensor histidine kinase [sulfur-oxidizing endosymbiont of Gigantopelta aegis]|uniref:trifunctional serine/threonine-protein kinase/ATP-binding protein/sensor histidine kinase n=1 Tax=sulfur-oxidizing endosymbiont of Gigantopelta aegis TaxID=2794934 RepID=UPI0018DC5801|nr:ATP-binding sensor histidine kinase [sulfur-oxidizing endosymbiont of Gigantopelta aegis]
MSEILPPQLTGYDINEALYEGAKSMVYRGVRQSDQCPVIVKFLKRDQPSHNELLNFCHQYNLLKEIQLDGVVRPLAMESWQDKLALVMPDSQSLDLKRYADAQPLNIDVFLNIACQLANILEQLHELGITHRDIKPGNIIIQPQSLQIALIDFSIASVLNTENQSLQNPDELSGTLSYLSPEQTGRMNRGVDYRTDFYSLGVTFYELLSAQLPFYSEDTMELVHCHLAKEPESLLVLHSEIPPAINEIVKKLMAKNAEERYQSGEGLMADLQYCQQLWQEKGAIPSFTLGQTDVARHFQLNSKLYGRFDEVKSFLGAFERVFEGNMEAIFIRGLSGVGKTALVNEVHKPMTRSRGYFIKGKFDQLKRDTPFSALSQALGCLIKQLLAENSDQQQVWKMQIQQVLGTQGQLLVDIVPELEQLIGPQVGVEELSGVASTYRFHHLFQQFLQIFTTQAHPLILFLDDLQWIDSATLQLLSVILNYRSDPQLDCAHQSLLFIGAYRDNEIPAEHPLHLTLDSLIQSGLPINHLLLKALSETDLNDMLMDACLCQSDYAQPLTQVVYKKTQGNPFFVHQFMQQVKDESLLSYDFKQEHWIYELESIVQLAASENVVEFVATRLRCLEPAIINILSYAACFGHQFDLATLAKVTDSTVSQCLKNCWQGVKAKLLIPVGDDYKLVPDIDLQSAQDDHREDDIKGLHLRFDFAHDRIQQAAYSLLPEVQKAQIHFDIGCSLKQQKQHQQQDKIGWLFNVVNQLNLAQHLVIVSTERIELATLNYQAGQAARRSTAYDSAGQYIKAGLSLLETETCWQTDYTLALGLYDEAIEVAFLLGDYQVQQQRAEILFAQSKTLTDTIKAHQLHCLSLIAQNDLKAAIQYALPMLKQCGFEFPAQATSDDFQAELMKTQAMLKGNSTASLINLPAMTETMILSGMGLLDKLNQAFYMISPVIFALTVFKRVQFAIQYGNAPEMLSTYAAYGNILSSKLNDINAGYEFGLLALALLDKLQATSQKSKTWTVVYGNQFYKQALRESIEPLKEASLSGLEVGDLFFSATGAWWASTHAFFAGEELSVLERQLMNYEQFIASLHQDLPLNYTQMLHQVTLNLMGAQENAIALQGELYDEQVSLLQYQKMGNRTAICFLKLYQSILAFVFFDIQRAYTVINQAVEYKDALSSNIFVPELNFYESLIRLAHYSEQTLEEQAFTLKQVIDNQTKMSFWKQYAPMNFAHKWALVEAEFYRVQGDFFSAEDYYDDAINYAIENKFVQEEALACELSARFYLQRNKTIIAQAYMMKAYYTWARWGAKAKTEQLEKEYPQLLNKLSKSKPDTSGSIRTVSSTSSLKNETSVGMDLDTVMKFAHSLSSELSLSSVLDRLLSTVMENAGAQRTILLLKESTESSNHLSKWHIAGECRMDNRTRQILHNTPLSEYQEIPKTLLQHVIKVKKGIALDDAREAYQAFYDDPYFVQDREQQSILCQPVLTKGKLTGLLYLENKLATHVFHQSRQQLMQMMAAQAAISLENALLYENLEDKVKERTHELKNAQAQLLQQARESGQAEIAIEVMHNIGNALTPLKTKTEQTYSAMHNSELVNKAPKLMQKLADALATHNGLEESERMKLTKITSMLPNIMATEYQSHADNLEQACNTIRRIEEFIHLQSKYTTVKPMNDYLDVNELLNDALKMLDNILRSEHIEVQLQCTDLPKLYAEEYQLMQIILSVVKNACEAMNGIAIEQRQIRISTYLEKGGTETAVGSSEAIVLCVQDNGIGFAPELKERIFAGDYANEKKQERRNTTPSSITSGFNLHACANYLIAHDGSISAQSEGVGKGAVFTIKLGVKNKV